jgi:hypothetical protein
VCIYCIDNNASANGKFKGRFIGGEKWKNPRLEISRIIASPLPVTKNASSGLLSLPLTHNPNSFTKFPCLAIKIYTYQNKALALIDNSASANGKFKGRFIGGEKWKNPRLEISRIKGNVLALVGDWNWLHYIARSFSHRLPSASN